MDSARPLPQWERSRAFSQLYVLLGVSLVDLKGFEPLTSSMPFKKYQSLADSLAQNKRLSKRRRGLRWTPQGGFGAFWTPRGLQDSTRGLARGVLSRARGCGLLYLLSSEGDNNRFPYKESAHGKGGDRRLDVNPRRLDGSLSAAHAVVAMLAQAIRLW